MLIDSLVHITQPLTRDRALTNHEDTMQKFGLKFTVILYLVNEQKRKTRTQGFTAIRHIIEHVMCPNEHLVMAEIPFLRRSLTSAAHFTIGLRVRAKQTVRAPANLAKAECRVLKSDDLFRMAVSF